MTPEQRIDAALDSVLKASGSALRHYTMPKTLADMREAMPYYTAQPGESATIRAQVEPGRWEDVPRRSEANK